MILFLAVITLSAQDAFGMPVDTTIFKNPELTIKIAEFDVLYVGNLEDATKYKRDTHPVWAGPGFKHEKGGVEL